MLLLSTFSHACRCSIKLALFSSLLILGCGGGGDSSSPPASNPVWAEVTYVSTSSTIASVEGTAWVSNSYYASNCAGLACFLDTSRTNDYPGVDVNYINLTTGASGRATSYYGPGTGWVHNWYAGVPVVAGSNNIQISAFDPGGKGGTMSIDVVPPPPLTVLSTTPLSGATGVLVNSTIAAQLSSAIKPGTNSIQVNGPNGAVAGTRSVSDSTVTFKPQSNLDYNTTYTVTLPTSLQAFSGSSLTSAYSWSFTTMAFPLFSVLSTYPPAGYTNTPANLTVSATFNGEIDPISIGSSSFFVRSPTGARWGYSYSVFGATMYVTDNIPLQANTTYTATITTRLSDKAGHSLPFDYVWTFTTSN